MDWIETETKQSYPIETGSKKGEFGTICPVCSEDRKPGNKTKKCLSLNTDKGTGFCFNCERTFYIKANGSPLPQPKGTITTRPINEAEYLYYWQQYGISKKILEVYGVLGVDHYQLGKHTETTVPENPIFCYQAGGNSYKIYRPFAIEGQNKFAWIGGKPEGWHFGLDFCKGSGLVYLAAGEKDVLTLVCQGVEAFTLNSETAKMPEELANQLKTQYRNVIVLYDNDPTGRENSLKICKEHGFIRAILPEGIKDVSDHIKAGRNIDEIWYDVPSENDFFICKTANEWIEESKAKPRRPQLVGPLITQGELIIVFGGPSVGKSALMSQIVDNLCRGQRTLGLLNEADPMIGLYVDCELIPKQWEERSTNKSTGETYRFHEKFHRAEISGLSEVDDEKLESVIFTETKKLADRKGANFIVIDNLSWLNSETEKAKFAVPLMRKLKRWVKDQGVTVVVINHPTKVDDTRPIKANDMAGSKQLHNLADMVWAIGMTANSKDYRYIKMLKHNRTSGEMYGSENVLVCELVKTDHLHFNYLTEGRETDYLPKLENREHNPKDDQKTAAKVLKSHGHNNIKIADLLNVTEGTIRQWLK